MEINKINITALQTIPTQGGMVRHVIKKTEKDFLEFGEAYLSYIEKGQIRGWKRHKKMTMNIVVPSGAVKFVFIVTNGQGESEMETLVVGEENYARLSIPPSTWFAFQGVGADKNIILNISNIEHDPEESEGVSLDTFPFSWEK